MKKTKPVRVYVVQVNKKSTQFPLMLATDGVHYNLMLKDKYLVRFKTPPKQGTVENMVQMMKK